MAIGADFTRSLLLDAGIGSRMRVLDVGCGTGDVSFEVARLVGDSGSVVGIDRNETALAQGRTRAAEKGLTRVEFVPADLVAPPAELGLFDAIVGRRVLMYLPDPAAAVAALARMLRPGGRMAFHEHDLSRPPNPHEMPLHAMAMSWVTRTVLAEGAEPNMGFRLYEVLAGAGLEVEGVRVSGNLQTPSQPYPLAELVSLMRPRILAQAIASDEEIGLDTLAERLDGERSSGIWLADLMFGAWGTRPGR